MISMNGQPCPNVHSFRVMEGDVMDIENLKEAMTGQGVVYCEITQKGEPIKGSSVSRMSVADLIVKLATNPELDVCNNRKRLRALLFRVMMPLVAKNAAFRALHEYYTKRLVNPLKKVQSLINESI